MNVLVSASRTILNVLYTVKCNKTIHLFDECIKSRYSVNVCKNIYELNRQHYFNLYYKLMFTFCY